MANRGESGRGARGAIRAGAAKWFIINPLKTILLHGPGHEDGSALALRIVLTCEVGILFAA